MIGYPVNTRKSSETAMRFIELTEKNNGQRRLVLNVSYILSVWEKLDYTELMLSTGDVLAVSEPFAKVHETIFRPI